jgi:hypothetical protein
MPQILDMAQYSWPNCITAPNILMPTYQQVT